MNEIFDLELKPIIEGKLSAYHHDLNFFPVVDGKNLLVGIIDENLMFDYNDSDIERSHPIILEKVPHVIQAIQYMKTFESNVLFVCTKERLYIGAITHASIVQFLQSNLNFSSIDSLLEISVKKHDYSFSEFAKIVESEGLRISLFWRNEDEDNIMITFVVNSLDLRSLISVLEAKRYTIINSFNEQGYDDILKDRYDHLMHYINI